MRRMPADTAEILRALRALHEQLTPVAARTEALTERSYCDDWTVAQVFSHLGSGAEIGRNLLLSTLGEGDPPPPNEEIWARWNAMSPAGMAAGYVEANERLLAAYEALDPDQAATLLLPYFIGPSPVPLVLTFRLHEAMLHTWDILVTDDPHATLLPGVAALALEVPLGLARFAAKPDAVDAGPVRLAITLTDPDRELAFTVDGGQGALATGRPDDPTGTLALPAEAFLRLFSGRLDPDHTPAGVTATGTPTLDELRKIFPGY
jgi:uncharacterized protein (TIGR03083 family)